MSLFLPFAERTQTPRSELSSSPYVFRYDRAQASRYCNAVIRSSCGSAISLSVRLRLFVTSSFNSETDAEPPSFLIASSTGLNNSSNFGIDIAYPPTHLKYLWL